MTDFLSRIVIPVDTHDEARAMEAQILPLLHATRDDSYEVRTVTKVLDSTGDVEVNIFVIVYTGNLRGMIFDLEAALII